MVAHRQALRRKPPLIIAALAAIVLAASLIAGTLSTASADTLDTNIAINAGGDTVEKFVADTSFDQGNQYTDTSTPIDTSGVTDPAPQAVYQTCRWDSSFSYTISELTAGAAYTVRLHWAELAWKEQGKRLFNVAINGVEVLSNFDVFATAGYKKALVKEIKVTVPKDGQIVIAFTQAGADNPFISAIQVLTRQSATPVVTPTTSADVSPTASAASPTVASGSPTAPVLSPTASTSTKAPGLSGAGTEDPYSFGTFRGTPVQVWETWNNQNTWEEMEALYTLPGYTGKAKAPLNVRFTGKMSIGQPLWAKNENASSCANGGLDQHYRNIATGLKNAGFPDAFVRLGWEHNGDWMWWHATPDTAGAWVQCFRHAYDAFKSVDPRFVITWNPNSGSNVSGLDARTTYPGDDKVDVVAVDFYDHDAYKDQNVWDANYNKTQNGSPYGIGSWIAFANSHNKPLAFPEWGLDRNSSTDNAFFINKMADTFDSLRSQGKLYWESYFNLEGCTFKLTDGCNPNASAVYVKRF
jgi:hypothetical protein